MKAVNIIREQLDKDFIKYSNTILCEIVNVWPLSIGDCLLEVYPLKSTDDFDEEGNLISEAGESPLNKETNDMIKLKNRETFNAILTSRPFGWIDKNLKNKYFALVLSPVKDRPFCSPAILVSKTTITSFSKWSRDLYDILAKKFEFILDGV